MHCTHVHEYYVENDHRSFHTTTTDSTYIRTYKIKQKKKKEKRITDASYMHV